jgi:aspartate/methionine/tyrosine aminotransferase
MEVGEPDFNTPEVVVEAGIKALRDGHTHYTNSRGLPELREALSAYYFENYGVEVGPERFIVTMGSSAAMMIAFAALLDPGDEAVMTDPHYACYPNFITTVGAVPAQVAVHEKDGFIYDLDALRNRLRVETKVLIINSPANPTGTLIPGERMEELSDVVCGKATIISDEIYHGLTYGEKADTILRYCGEAVVISGFSKLFAMTGWRLGYMILPERLLRVAGNIQQNLFISAPDFPQHAAVVALTKAGDDVERMRLEYDRRRRFMLDRLRGMGFEIPVEPTGAFYIFVNVSRYTDDVRAFAFELLEQAGVAVTPGIDFGERGEGFVRFSYANSLENLREGMDRLERYLVERT